MHSSRMRTACLLTIMGGGGSAQPRGSASRGVCPTQGGLHPWRGGLPNLGGLHPEGSGQPWGVFPTWGVCIRGVCPTPGVCIGGGGLGRLPPPVNRMTHRCKNITLPQTSFAGGKDADYFGSRIATAKGNQRIWMFSFQDTELTLDLQTAQQI